MYSPANSAPFLRVLGRADHPPVILPHRDLNGRGLE